MLGALGTLAVLAQLDPGGSPSPSPTPSPTPSGVGAGLGIAGIVVLILLIGSLVVVRARLKRGT